MKLLTTTQATEWLASQRGIEVDASTVRRWCREGRLKAAKPGHDWLVSVEALANVEPPRPGPKPKGEDSGG